MILLLIIIVIVIIAIVNSNKSSGNSSTYKTSTVKTNIINCSFQTDGSYSSILNCLQRDVYHIAKHSRGYGEISVVVIVQKIDNIYCKISGSFLADCSFSGVNFCNGYRFNGTDNVQFETTQAKGFTTLEDIKREILLQFNWDDLPVYNAEFTILNHGDFTNKPYISYSFIVKKVWFNSLKSLYARQ